MRGVVASACVLLCASVHGCGRIGFDWHSDLDAAQPDAREDRDGDVDAADLDGSALLDRAMADTSTGDASVLDATLDASGDGSVITDAADDAPSDAGNDAGPGPIEPTYPVIAAPTLSSTGYHTCLTRSGRLYCWGGNSYGQLGLGDTNPRDTAVEVTLPNGARIAQVSAGDEHTCAIEQDNGAVWCWGRNQLGQLGLGDRMQRDRPTRVSGLPRAIQLSASLSFTCAITEDNALWCWGGNSEGQLGLDDTASPIAERDTPTRSGADNDWIQIATGQGRSCGLRQPGNLWCTGRNFFYGFGLGTNMPNEQRAWTRSGTATDWRAIESGQDGTCGTRSDARVYCWGTFATTPETVRTTPQTIAPDRFRTHATGAFNGCGILETGALACWGRNVEGQLGAGDWNDRGGTTTIGGDLDWLHVVMGRFHTCAQKQNTNVYCTGENNVGQLGLGDLQRRNVFTQIALP